jgi:hypothetical protein
MKTYQKIGLLLLGIGLTLVGWGGWQYLEVRNNPEAQFQKLIHKATVYLKSDTVCIEATTLQQYNALLDGQRPYDDFGRLKKGLTFVHPDFLGYQMSALCYKKQEVFRSIYGSSDVLWLFTNGDVPTSSPFGL